MKKSMAKLIALTFVATFGFGIKAYAGSVSLVCEKDELKKGESTTCTITAQGFTDNITSFTAEISSNYLTMSNPIANTAAGFANNGSTNTVINFTRTGEAISGSVSVGSFTMTLSENAQDIGNGTCGSFCLKNVRVNNTPVDNANESSEGICIEPDFVVEECVGEECDPNTGAFASYALLGGGALVALVVIMVVRKNSKFYNV